MGHPLTANCWSRRSPAGSISMLRLQGIQNKESRENHVKATAVKLVQLQDGTYRPRRQNRTCHYQFPQMNGTKKERGKLENQSSLNCFKLLYTKCIRCAV
jgi:hypothetical protein